MMLAPRRLLLLLLPLLALPAMALAQPRDPSFRLTNATTQPINQVHVSPSIVAAWGDDRLGSGTLRPDATASIQLAPGPCLNDIRVVFADGSAREKRQVNTCLTKDITFP
jgi:hypothetical protein